MGSNHTVKFSKGTWHQNRNSGKNRSIARNYPKSVRRMSVVLARQNSVNTLHQERCARKAAWDLAKHIYKLKNADKATLETPI